MATSTAAVSLASFSSQARGIKFYGVSTTSIRVGESLDLRLDPSNHHDGNCVALWLTRSWSSPTMLGNLAREAAFHLAPLMRSGLSVSG